MALSDPARGSGTVRTVGISTSVVAPHRMASGLDGIGTYTLALAERLPSLGIAVRRVDSPHFAGRRVILPEYADVRLRVPLSAAIAAGALARTATPASTPIERELDLYHSTDYLVPRLARTPVVATLYDAIPLAHPEWANQRLRRVKNWLLVRSARNADLVIAISQSAREEVIHHYGIEAARTRVVPLGVDASWFDMPDAARVDGVLRSMGLERGYYLFVGTLQPRKNVSMLIDAYEAIPRADRATRQLVIAGKYGWGVESLRARLHAGREEGRCVWLDYVPAPALRALYAGAGAFVLPSQGEGFGLPILEALASGLPVIASDLPALREVGGECVRYVRANDRDALFAALASVGTGLLGDGVPLVEARRRHARAYTWQACAERTRAVYEELW